MKLVPVELNNKKALIAILIGTFSALFSFPENDWTFSIGIDYSLKWAFNWLFNGDLSIGEHIVFPHGPLAFLTYPTQENIVLAMSVLMIAKLLLAVNIIYLTEKEGWSYWLVAFLLTYVISMIAGMHQLILANVVLLYCNYFIYKRNGIKVFAFVITAFAFYIKSYLAILSGLICASFVLYSFVFCHRKLKTLLQDIGSIVGALLILWLIIFGNLSGFPRYVAGMFHLAQDNSSAASYYPQNNWLQLGIFLVASITLFFIINRTRRSFFFSFLVLLSFFAAWKHGLAREDFYHFRGFLVYVFIVFSIFVVFNRKHTFLNLIVGAVAVVMLFLNIRNTVNYNEKLYRWSWGQPTNFVEFVLHFSELKEKSLEVTDENISSKKLPQAIHDSIKGATVDIYPWEYSIIPANDLELNWIPRPVIQSYASYTHWLDQQNFKHFGSPQAPEYIIWELDKISTDINGGSFNSIDNRYLLNDEPQTILQILKSYDHFYKDQQFLILKRRDVSIDSRSSTFEENTTTWGEWISVPEGDSGLLRVKMDFKKHWKQRLKSFFYKDEQFWIYLKLNSGLVHKYRIVPKNASDGIWIAPYLFKIDQAPEVKQIMFKCSNQETISQNINLKWEQTQFGNNPGYVLNFFNKMEFQNDSMIFASINQFEGNVLNHWSSVNESNLTVDKYSGQKACVLRPNSFSTTFSYSLDQLPFGQWQIGIDCWVKSSDYDYSNQVILVLEINDEDGRVLWEGQAVDGQLLDGTRWNNISNFVSYVHDKANCMLKGYLWNSGDNEVIVDDLRFSICIP